MVTTYTDTFEVTAVKGREVRTMRRCSKIRMVRRRLAEGWYDRDDLLDIVIERILTDVVLA
ncbi:MAG: hypothetical protein ABFE13_17930 [Phycisphaerales bacterium]